MSMSADEPNLVSHAGLVAVAELAQRLGVAERIDAHLDLSGTPGQANEGTKAMTVLGGLLAAPTRSTIWRCCAPVRCRSCS